MGMVEGEGILGGLDIVNGRTEAFVSWVQLGGSQPGLHWRTGCFWISSV